VIVAHEIRQKDVEHVKVDLQPCPLMNYYSHENYSIESGASARTVRNALDVVDRACERRMVRGDDVATKEEGFMIKRIKFVGVPVQDQDRALAFWKEKMGFRVITDQPMGPGRRWIEMGIPGGQTGIALFTPPGHETRIGTFSGLSFGCDDVGVTHKELSDRGVEFSQPPKKESWGTSAIFKDSEGNAFVLGSN
jgi:predicted enzyme related to lactoylglutathione lyase